MARIGLNFAELTHKDAINFGIARISECAKSKSEILLKTVVFKVVRYLRDSC